MGDREKRLEAAGYPLDRGPKEGPVIDLLSVLGDTVYASGQVPYDAGQLTSKGKVPSQVSVEDATTAAALAAAAHRHRSAARWSRCSRRRPHPTRSHRRTRSHPSLPFERRPARYTARPTPRRGQASCKQGSSRNRSQEWYRSPVSPRMVPSRSPDRLVVAAFRPA